VLVARHQRENGRVVLSTATCCFPSEPSAAHLGIDELIAGERELDTSGRFSGRGLGALHMREGKVQRLHRGGTTAWACRA
jgi:phosphoserine phosphatase